MNGASPDPITARARAGCCRAASADAGPATGAVRDRVGTRLAGARPDFERDRSVPGGVLGRLVAGAAVPGARDRHRPVRPRGAGGVRFRLLRFRWPSREEALSRLDRGTGIRHRPATALTDTLAIQRSDRAGAVARAARAHAGLDQADSRRPAVAAAANPRSLGAARAGHGDAGRGLFRRRRRAQPCGSPRRSTGTACWRRPTSGSMPG